MGFDWSALHDLADFAAAPAEEGLYVVGIYHGSQPRQAVGLPCTDDYLGSNWPDDFHGKMIGRAWKTTLRGRLKDHFEKSSNRHLRDYLRVNGDHSLSFIYITRDQLKGGFDDPRYMEHFFLTTAQFEWAGHKHEKKSFDAALQEWADAHPPSPLATWWDPRDG